MSLTLGVLDDELDLAAITTMEAAHAAGSQSQPTLEQNPAMEQKPTLEQPPTKVDAPEHLAASGPTSAEPDEGKPSVGSP